MVITNTKSNASYILQLHWCLPITSGFLPLLHVWAFERVAFVLLEHRRQAWGRTSVEQWVSGGRWQQVGSSSHWCLRRNCKHWLGPLSLCQCPHNQLYVCSGHGSCLSAATEAWRHNCKHWMGPRQGSRELSVSVPSQLTLWYCGQNRGRTYMSPGPCYLCALFPVIELPVDSI